MIGASHVTDLLDRHAAGELPADDARRVAEHLLACPACRARYDAVRSGRAALSALPLESAPEALWGRIARRVEDDAASRLTIRPMPARPRPWAARLAAAVVFFVASAAAGSLLVASLRAARWEIAAWSGAPRVDGRPLSGDHRVAAGDRIETDGSSRATVRIGRIGETEVRPNTRLRVVSARPSEHRLALEHGSIYARISAPPRLFVVETPIATAIDLGCEYILDVDSTGSSVLRVTLGWVALEDRNGRTLVPMGTTAVTQRGRGIGLPVYDDATDALRAAAAALERDPRDEVALAIVMSESRRRDAITLWHLLPRLEGRSRARAAMRLAELVAPPADARIEHAIALDERALDRWLEEIEPAWSVIREPEWKRVVTGLWEYIAARSAQTRDSRVASALRVTWRLLTT